MTPSINCPHFPNDMERYPCGLCMYNIHDKFCHLDLSLEVERMRPSIHPANPLTGETTIKNSQEKEI